MKKTYTITLNEEELEFVVSACERYWTNMEPVSKVVYLRLAKLLDDNDEE